MSCVNFISMHITNPGADAIHILKCNYDLMISKNIALFNCLICDFVSMYVHNYVGFANP